MTAPLFFRGATETWHNIHLWLWLRLANRWKGHIAPKAFATMSTSNWELCTFFHAVKMQNILVHLIWFPFWTLFFVQFKKKSQKNVYRHIPPQLNVSADRGARFRNGNQIWHHNSLFCMRKMWVIEFLRFRQSWYNILKINADEIDANKIYQKSMKQRKNSGIQHFFHGFAFLFPQDCDKRVACWYKTVTHISDELHCLLMKLPIKHKSKFFSIKSH